MTLANWEGEEEEEEESDSEVEEMCPANGSDYHVIHVHSKKGGRRHDDFCNLMLHQFVQAALAGPTSIFVKIILSLKDQSILWNFEHFQ